MTDPIDAPRDADDAEADGAQSAFSQVPIEILVCVGHTRPPVRELLALRPQAVLELDRRVDDPVELYIGDRLIARGELQELDGPRAGQLAVRITEAAEPQGDL